MSYALLCLGFLAVAVAAAVAARRSRPAGHGAALALTAAGLGVLTAVFDSVMIAAGLFAYDDAQLLGLRLGLAPVEDLAYPVAALLLCSAIWNLSAAKADDRGRPA